jgi:3-phosphoshikimate 1-carboxyvinyltransferase
MKNNSNIQISNLFLAKNDLQICIPGSKSESNRSLIIQAFANDRIQIQNLSNSDDTLALIAALASTNKEIDCGHAGSTFRFLAAYFACCEGKEVILTGSPQLKNRPMAPLIAALQALGAEITYLEQPGFAPIHIKGKILSSSKPIEIDSSISSQFITALLLIATQIENGLSLKLQQNSVSKTYIQMTIALLNEVGIAVSADQETIKISQQKIQSHIFHIEPDWSSASYWYAIKALGFPNKIFLKGFKKESLQGDSCIAKFMENFGVQTTYHSDGIELTSKSINNSEMLFDCINCPDIAQTLITTAAAMRLPYSFTGLQTLAHKESNRTQALKAELAKIGATLKDDTGVFYLSYSNNYDFQKPIHFETYQDHRMAMCLAPLSLKWTNVTIENPSVVQKSYRSFWDDFATTGLTLKLQ